MHPPEEILEKYADVLVNFALNSGLGVKKGEVVFLQVPECAKPLLIHLRRVVLKAGAHPIIQFIPDGIARDFFELASDSQLEFFPEKLLMGRIEEIDHAIFIIAETNKKELEGISPEKIMRNSSAFKKYFEWRNKKEDAGKFTWTLALYGTEAMAKEAGLSLHDYWEQIIKACYLELEKPIEKWQNVFLEVERVKEKLDSLDVDKLHVIGEDVDLFIGLDENRKWLGGSGRNIPSFEVYISPDCRRTEGWIRFNQPLYRYGNLIENVFLRFEKGKVVEFSAGKGEEVLRQMIATEGADRVGEYSLTDRRLSRIDKFMAETLFDENFGGEFGNTHLALGNAYRDSYPGDKENMTKEQWEEIGYNESVVHTDIVSTSNRKVVAYLKNGEKVVIYENGQFIV